MVCLTEIMFNGHKDDRLANGSLFKVSQRGATEELADQVSTKTAAAHRRLEEASSHPHEKKKDEAHKSSKGHVSGK